MQFSVKITSIAAALVLSSCAPDRAPSKPISGSLIPGQVALAAWNGDEWARTPSMLPDPKLTPGATDPAVTQSTIGVTICKPGYTKSVRSVSEADKKEVMRRYGLPESELSKVEIDHFISLEIGGSNVLENLWPEYYDGPAGYLGARDKDVVETSLHRAVCSNRATLAEAQEAIRNWTEAYRTLKHQVRF